ncbi:related to SAC1 protein [Cephalotrichum gorgonifer]|uniref:Related to SAC1 protein n=1 Tax=Cephalotrichum gorgonifer TaxID=2041049 RepID=A0AAE8MY11_9PEZI|nr:related to SAC1 protein [Cephalotrichum gorgonifer]
MSILKGPLFPYRDINVQVADSTYTFTSPSSPDAPALVIDRPTGDIHLDHGAAGMGSRPYQVMSINGILGIIQLRLDKYVIVITKSQPIGRLKGHMVYKVLATQILPMRRKQIRDPDEDRFISLLQASLKNGTSYFSYSIDITNSFQRQSQADTTQPLWMRADDRFFWNRFVQSDLIDYRTQGGRGQPGPNPGIDPFILPVIFGMFEIRPTTFKGTPLTLILVSRRSRYRAGTRFFTRGLDSQGNAANYNETEQILILNDNGNKGISGFAGGDGQGGRTSRAATDGQDTQVLSYVQTRGSVPTYWAEINTLKYTPKLQVRGIETALPAAQKHLDEQIKIYGDNYLINLVNQKGREQAVKQSYERMVEMLVSSPKSQVEANQLTSEKFHIIQPGKTQSEFDRAHYVYFDFHSETKGMRLDRAYRLIERLAVPLQEQGYFRGVDMPASQDGRLEARSLQTSVMRSNCMDCLDRTNVVQSMFARHTLDRMFAELGLMSPNATFRDEDPAFEFLFRNIWADNADVISSSYSGTGAMKTDMTRMGTRTKVGMLNDGKVGVTRYFKNNFLDGPRQDSYDLLTGAYLPGRAPMGPGSVFADRRPLLIQAVPYMLAFSLFFVLFAMFAPADPTTYAMPRRIVVILFLLVAVWCFHFVSTHGMLYVNWPKLAPRPYATEGFNDQIAKASKDAVIGSFVPRHERGASIAQYRRVEEGKED